MDEVMSELGFSMDEKQEAKDFLTVDLTFLLDEGTDLPQGWVPQIGPMSWPVPGLYYVSSGFGTRPDPFTGEPKKHTGIDIPGPEGTTIVSVNKGVIIHAGKMDGYGNLVIVDHGGGVTTYYGHLQSVSVSRGQVVEKDQPIGKMGSTGRSTGPHLHFEVRVNGKAVDPLSYFK